MNAVSVRNVNDPMPTGQADIGTILLSLSEMDTIVSHYATRDTLSIRGMSMVRTNMMCLGSKMKVWECMDFMHKK